MLALALGISLTASAQTKQITTICGTGAASYGGDNTFATAAKLNNPSGVAVDDSGKIYIADKNNGRIRRINRAGIIVTMAGNGTPGFTGNNIPATNAAIAPSGIAVDDSGNVYIAEANNNCVRRVSKTGIISMYAGNGTSGFMGDNGIATAAELANPVAVAVDAAHNLYISDQNNNRIRKVTPLGIITTVAGGGSGGMGDGGPATAGTLSGPAGIALDKVGNLFIVDQTNNVIRKVNTSGVISTFAGSGAVGFSGDGGNALSARFNYPVNVAVDDSNFVYIVEGNNNVIRKVDAIGNINTVVGVNSPGFSGDGGPATAAKISNPAALAIDTAGQLFIADLANHRIRKVAPKSHVGVQTVASQSGSLAIWPNPAANSLNVTAEVNEPAACNASISITDASGRVLYTNVATLAAGKLDTSIDIDSFPAGTYFLSLSSAAGTFSSGFVKH